MKLAFRRMIILVIGLGLWELISGTVVSSFFISRPSEIAAYFAKIAMDGTLLENTTVTALEAVFGFVVGGAAGALTGLILGRKPSLAATLDPFITAFYSLPKVALAPLFIMWFGVGFKMRIIFIAVVVFFLVFLNTYSGVKAVSRELVNMFRLMGASERHLVKMVVMPSAITWVFAGLHLSVPYALIGAIIAEMMASNVGLGFLIQYNASQFNAAGVFAVLIAVVILALCLDWAVRWLEHTLMPWQTTEQTREATI